MSFFPKSVEEEDRNMDTEDRKMDSTEEESKTNEESSGARYEPKSLVVSRNGRFHSALVSSPPPLLGRCASTPLASFSSSSSSSYLPLLFDSLSPLATSASPSSRTSSSLKKARSVSELDSGVATSLEETEWSTSFHEGRVSIAKSNKSPIKEEPTDEGIVCSAKPKKRWRRCRTRDICLPSFTPASTSESSESHSSATLPSFSLINPVGTFLKWEKVDVIRHAMEMGLIHVVASILSHVSNSDLPNVMLVSTSWSVALATDNVANRRRIDFVAGRKRNIENSGFDESDPIAANRRLRAARSTPRKAMSNVSNLLSPKASSKSVHDVVSPSKVRHKLFTDEAAKLGPGEQLCTCPRCASPSRFVPSSNTGNCGRAGCGFVFCTKCLCEIHPQTSCRKTRSSGRSNSNRIGSKASKLRLSRLLS